MAYNDDEEAEWKKEGIGIMAVETGEERRKKRTTDARGGKGVTVDWGREPEGWRRTRPKRAGARER